jgi:hypothetical protein
MLLGETREGALMCIFPSLYNVFAYLMSLSITRVEEDSIILPTWWGVFDTVKNECVFIISLTLPLEQQLELVNKGNEHGGYGGMLTIEDIKNLPG